MGSFVSGFVIASPVVSIPAALTTMPSIGAPASSVTVPEMDPLGAIDMEKPSSEANSMFEPWGQVNSPAAWSAARPGA